MHLLYVRSPQICRIPCNYAARGRAVSGRKVGDSRLNRIAEEPGGRTSERERKWEQEREWCISEKEKDREEPNSRTADRRRNADAVSLVHSQAHPLTPLLERLWMNSPTPANPLRSAPAPPLHESSIVHMCASAPRKPSRKPISETRRMMSWLGICNQLYNILIPK